MRNLAVVLQVLAVMFACSVCSAGSKKERHSHDGILKPYSGKHIPYTISIAENVALGEGKPVIINERNGKDGRGVVIQDVHAVPEICMDRIRDLAHYHKMVKNVKKVTPYDTMKFENGTEVVGAEFNVGLSLLTFTYFLKLKYDPAYFTLTWTLDYQYNSDFDDNTGHWQVVQHPTKPGWSRIVYSCEVKVFNWLPDFVINFMTKTALVESTAWVKRESEKLAGSSTASMAPYPLGDMSECFSVDSTEGTAKYMTNCAEAKVIQRTGHSDSVHSDL